MREEFVDPAAGRAERGVRRARGWGRGRLAPHFTEQEAAGFVDGIEALPDRDLYRLRLLMA